MNKLPRLISSSMCVDDHPYKEVDGQWIPDEEARDRQLKQTAKEQKEKDDLIFACRTRLLSPEEMIKVESYGSRLFVRMVHGGISDCFFQEEIDKRFNELMLQQFRLRRIAESE